MSSNSKKSTKVKQSKIVRREINYQDINPYNQFMQQQPQYFATQNSNPYPYQQPFPNQFSQQQFPQTQQFHQQQHFSQPSFAQYITQEVQAPNFTQMLNENETQTPEENDAYEEGEEEVVPSQKGKQRKQIFSEAEDILLARAFIRVSENASKGNDNKISLFWSKITSEYNSMANESGFEQRVITSLKNRFTKMRGEMVLYNRAIHTVNSVHHTGENEMGMIKKVRDKFMEFNSKCKNRAFGFDHVVEILSQSSKFNYTTTRNRIPTVQEVTNSSPSEGSPESPIGASRASTQQSNDLHSGDKRSRASLKEIVSSPKRPIGSKAAKRAEKLMKGKGKLGDGSGSKDEFSEQYFTQREQEFEFKREAHMAKIKAFETNIEMEARRLSLKEKELSVKQQEMTMKQQAAENDAANRELAREQQIINMELDSMPTEEAKAQLWDMKTAILKKWASGL